MATESLTTPQDDTDVDVPMHLVSRVAKQSNLECVRANGAARIVPSKNQVKKIVGPLTAEKRALGWGLLKDLEPWQRKQLYLDAEMCLNAKTGTLTSTGELQSLFDKQYNAIMVSHNRRHMADPSCIPPDHKLTSEH